MKYDKSKLAKRWIESLKVPKILTLGKKYMKTHEVYDIEIKDCVVSAKTKSNNYTVTLTFSKFSRDMQRKITSSCKKNLSAVLNYEIPDTLLKLFDVYHETVRVECSCRDKNTAYPYAYSLFYNLYLMISQNPFVLFEIHDFELISYYGDIKNISEIINCDYDLIGENNSYMVHDLIKTNMLLLQDRPVFYRDDFKAVLYDLYKEMGKYIPQLTNLKYKYNDFIILGNTFQFFENKKKYSNNSDKFHDKWMEPSEWMSFNVDINENYEIASINTFSDKNPFTVSNLDSALFGFLLESDYSDKRNFNDNIEFFYSLYNFTQDLLIHHAAVPELFKKGNDEYMIRWIPAIYDENVNAICCDFSRKCPDDLITFNGEKISKKSQILIAVSLLIKAFIKNFTKHAISLDYKKLLKDDIFKLFFNKPQKINLDDALAINNWLSYFSLRNKNHTFLFEIENIKKLFKASPKVMLDNGETVLLDDAASPEIIKDRYIMDKIYNNFNHGMKLNKKGYFNIDSVSYCYENIMPLMEEIGIETKLPEEFGDIAKPEIILKSDEANLNTDFTLDELSKFDWKVAIGDKLYSMDEFEDLTKKYSGLVKIANEYVYFDEKSDLIVDKMHSLPEMNQHELMQSFLTGEFEELEINMDRQLSDKISQITKIDDIEVPSSLNCQLRPYQEIGYSWLVQNIKTGFGSILADDMGLGKTVQVLTAILYLKENDLIKGQVLVIAPTSLLTNWQKEIEEFTPTLASFIYHGKARTLPDEDYDIILTSYGILRKDFKEFNDIFLMVVDEAQNIKNTSSKQTRAIKSVECTHKIALSGTPIENRLSEYWSIFDFINRGYLSSLENFKQKYINPIEKHHDKKTLDNFKLITQPFILRRQKSDKNIIRDLPEKNVNDIYCNLSSAQTALYQENLDHLMNGIETEDGIERKGIIFKLINTLKQICNHPAQFLKSKKATVEESGKMEVLMNILENILDSDEKVLIFTQYVQMGEIIQKLVFDKFKTEVMFFRGSLSRKQRDDIIDKFQNDPKYKILVVSLKAGGTGLNLTAASNVIHYDLWWNPAVENQATDRAYRIGQTRDVMVYRFITRGTFEEKINMVLKQKEELANMAIASNEKFITEMTNDELKEMLNLRRF